ncbi:hypothetical protein C8J57DRAFT_1475614 [Mycena rebaudengoi]|nr:hypothetical protein C8J57DRAFT_1475614 [Mycena rebaudengoi]
MWGDRKEVKVALGVTVGVLARGVPLISSEPEVDWAKNGLKSTGTILPTGNRPRCTRGFTLAPRPVFGSMLPLDHTVQATPPDFKTTTLSLGLGHDREAAYSKENDLPLDTGTKEKEAASKRREATRTTAVEAGRAIIDHVRTSEEPHPSIPTFDETITLFMLPENLYASFNVDVKLRNDPARLFRADVCDDLPRTRTGRGFLAPHIQLGLRHPASLVPAKAYIGNSPTISRQYIWDDCEMFSISFGALTGADGERFRRECKEGGKKIIMSTVNEPDHMMEAVGWKVDMYVARTWLDLLTALRSDYDALTAKYSRFFLWTTLHFYAPIQSALAISARDRLESAAGPFEVAAADKKSTSRRWWA